MEDSKSVLGDPEVRQLLEEIIGEEGMSVVGSLMGRSVTDEEISEETNLKLNVVRRILYKLYDYRMASYVRTKNKEIGWYIYTWELDLNRAFDILAARKKRILKELYDKLEFEKAHVFFRCKNDNSKVAFDVAGEFNFKCPECNGDLEYVDNQTTIMTLENEIDKLKKEIINV